MRRSLLTIGEKSSRLDHDVDTEILPGQGLRVTYLQDLECLSVDQDGLVTRLDVVRQDAEHRVVLEKMSHRLDGPQVVHGDNLDVCP
jgi:hypothetical protein